LITISIILAAAYQAPIAQDKSYHQFFDSNTIFNIPNFWNVLSNLPFLFVGIWGTLWIIKSDTTSYLHEIKLAYFALFIGVGLVSIGSGYYHLSPNNNTLMWDRLPMTIAFMALFSIILSEFIHIQLGRILLLPLLIVGISSVMYWHFSELAGQGDLRFYALVQFLPILIIPIILIFFQSVFDRRNAYWLLLAAYLLAKILEYYDEETHRIVFFLSGHSLKHIVAAAGVYLLLRSYKTRLRC